MDLPGSTVLVTGASGGIGRAIATDLAGAGAHVLAVARRAETLDELAAIHPRIRPLPCDLTDVAARTALLRDLGPIDAVVNNAGAAWVGSFLDMTAEEVTDLFDLNVNALLAVCAGVVPGMVERDRGHVVNIGSILAFAPSPPVSVYSATKGAVHAFTEGLRRELVDTEVRVSLVAPGPVKGTAALDDAGDDDTASTLERAFDRFGTTAEDVAAGVRAALEGDGGPATRTITVPCRG